MKLPLLVRRTVGKSMEPTIKSGKLLFTSSYSKISEGSVVIIKLDGKEIVKRIKIIDGDKFFVLGDNSEMSTDSRTFGWVNKDNLIGKVVWPII
jgi:nickel-type superoxide dismutase maturation protease